MLNSAVEKRAKLCVVMCANKSYEFPNFRDNYEFWKLWRERLSNPVWRARKEAYEQLGVSDDHRAISLLIEGLRDEEGLIDIPVEVSHRTASARSGISLIVGANDLHQSFR